MNVEGAPHDHHEQPVHRGRDQHVAARASGHRSHPGGATHQGRAEDRLIVRDILARTVTTVKAMMVRRAMVSCLTSMSAAGNAEQRAVADGKVVSVVVPCFNEQDMLPETHRRLTAVLRAMPADYEIVFVDDGSTDRSPAILAGLAAEDGRVRVVSLSRNFGHQIAITAGVEHASGDAVVLIDADLQDPPELIPHFFAEWTHGYEVVYGLRRAREGETAFKRWTANAFYRIMAALSDTRIPLDAGDFRLMDRQVVSALARMPERDRFVRG